MGIIFLGMGLSFLAPGPVIFSPPVLPSSPLRYGYFSGINRKVQLKQVKNRNKKGGEFTSSPPTSLSLFLSPCTCREAN